MKNQKMIKRRLKIIKTYKKNQKEKLRKIPPNLLKLLFLKLYQKSRKH